MEVLICVTTFCGILLGFGVGIHVGMHAKAGRSEGSLKDAREALTPRE